MKKYLSLILVVLMSISLIFGGCQNKVESNNNLSNDNGEEDKSQLVDSKKKDSLIVGLCGMPIQNMDPHQHSVGGIVDIQLFDALVIVDNYSTEIVPCLAESWEVNDKCTEYIFKLRENVIFHNGEHFTANDVKFSFDRAKEASFLQSTISMVENVEVLSEYSVKITLNVPYAPFLKAAAQIFIVNEKTINEQGEASLKTPIGTGPYKLEEWNEKDQTVRFIKNESYFGQKASISKLVFKTINSMSTASIALEAGDIDFTMTTANEYYTMKENKNLQFEYQPTSHSVYLTFNNKDELTGNKLLRQAICYAIDRESMCMVLDEGLSKPAEGYVFEGVFGYSDKVKVYEYNLEKAKEIMKQLNLGNIELSFISDNDMTTKIAQMVQANLADIGITLNIEQIDAAAFDEKVFGGTYQMGYWGATNKLMDADDLYKWYQSSSSANITYYKNEEFDKFIEEARASNSDEKRKELYEKVQSIIKEDATILPLYYTTMIYAYQKGLKTSGVIPSGHQRFSNYSWQ